MLFAREIGLQSRQGFGSVWRAHLHGWKGIRIEVNLLDPGIHNASAATLYIVDLFFWFDAMEIRLGYPIVLGGKH